MSLEKQMNKATPEVATFKTMRIAVGVLAISLPITVVLAGLLLGDIRGFLNSISAYYNSSMRDIYVGEVCMIAFFLLSYKGYDRHDNWSCNIAGILAFGIALFPTIDNRKSGYVSWIWFLDPVTVDWVHTVCASAFFCVLAYISIFLFTHTHEGAQVVGVKRSKNLAFTGTGILIMLALVSLLTINLSNPFSLRGTPVTLALEALMMISFGSSWLVKGVF